MFLGLRVRLNLSWKGVLFRELNLRIVPFSDMVMPEGSRIHSAYGREQGSIKHKRH